ncbi:hypothetical protein BOTBODRAFT_114771 [Botryobasidium botryosum FD-172 SS1]|uniref:PHD-type domain-containing protein n=1 Tax=Botryobasidium botryosum (strain FD-172 SS1) TaxID=930990 RepID=A0A067M5X7_BOTB1|nr:hypothetical protein BOTBODRAFT_114771 [Botryobasidium botryosum FD-172 SS1]
MKHSSASAPDTGLIRCICSFDDDDGSTIFCDGCGIWQHMSCGRARAEPDLPEKWFCEVCVPRAVDRVAAKEAQIKRRALEHAREKEAIYDAGTVRRRRAIAISITPAEEENLLEPWAGEYVPLGRNVVRDEEAKTRLREWRKTWQDTARKQDNIAQKGEDSEPVPPSECTPIPTQSAGATNAISNISSAPGSIAYSRPATYALYAPNPIPSLSLISEYRCTVTPRSAYTSAHSSQYPLLSLPKPHVHLLPPPLSLALDAREAGNEARWVRSGCHPNAVLRPVVCDEREQEGGVAFGVFAIRDLKAREEVVLGWEWDDGSVVHMLPAIVEGQGLGLLHDKNCQDE